MTTRSSRRSSTGVPSGAKAQLRLAGAAAAAGSDPSGPSDRFSPRSSAGSSPRHTPRNLRPPPPPAEDAAEKGAGNGGGNGNSNGNGSDRTSSITVIVRVRPLSARELADESRSVVRVMSQKLVVMLQPSVASTDYLRQGRASDKRFAFDSAWGPEASQEEVYGAATRSLLPPVLEGFHVTTLAYGPTGSGKTYSMSGTRDSPGIMVLTLIDLFALIDAASQGRQYRYDVSLSLLEIYNENIRDLLVGAPGADSQQYHHQRSASALGGGGFDAPDTAGSGGSSGDKGGGGGGGGGGPSGSPHSHVNPNSLELREDPLRGMVIAGISEVRGIGSSAQILSLLEAGNRRRTTEPTKANEVSSRSHQILQIVVERHEVSAGIVAETKVGRLSLIDLAGSERASKTENRGARLVEGANINRSLLALANVISHLARGGGGGGNGGSGSDSSGNDHVNYRDSKLTRLLKRSLTDGKTVMISCVSPAESSYDESLNTLKYADRAKNIRTKVESNERSVAVQVHQYEAIIGALRGEIQTLKRELWEAASGIGSLSPPIASAPQHRLSRIPSVARGGFSVAILHVGAGAGAVSPSKLAALPELPGTGGEEEQPAAASSASAAAAAASAAAAFRSGRDSRLLASPSRLQQPTQFFPDMQTVQAQAAAAQARLQAQLQQAAAQQQLLQPMQSVPGGRTRVSPAHGGQRHRGGRHRGAEHHSIGGAGAGGGAHSFFPALGAALSPTASPPRSLTKREKMERFLQSPEREQEDIAAAFAYLRPPIMPAPSEANPGSGSASGSGPGADRSVPAVVLPSSLGPTLAAWPFDLLRRLWTKVQGEHVAAREKLIAEVLRPQLALRTRLQSRQTRVRAIEAEAAAAAATAEAAAAALEARRRSQGGDGGGGANGGAGMGSPSVPTSPSMLPSSLRSELESLSERLGRLDDAGAKLAHKVAFKAALADLVLRLLRERIERRDRTAAEGAAGRRMPDMAAAVGAGGGGGGGGGANGGSSESEPPSNARQMLSIEHRALQTVLSRLGQAENDLRSSLALLAVRERADQLEALAVAQGALLRRELLPRLATAEGERRKEVEAVAARAAGLVAERAQVATAPLPLIVSPSAARAAIRMQAASPVRASGGGGGVGGPALAHAQLQAPPPAPPGVHRSRSRKRSSPSPHKQGQARSRSRSPSRSRRRAPRAAAGPDLPSPQASPSGATRSTASSPTRMDGQKKKNKSPTGSQQRQKQGRQAERSKRAAISLEPLRAPAAAASATASPTAATTAVAPAQPHAHLPATAATAVTAVAVAPAAAPAAAAEDDDDDGGYDDDDDFVAEPDAESEPQPAHSHPPCPELESEPPLDDRDLDRPQVQAEMHVPLQPPEPQPSDPAPQPPIGTDAEMDAPDDAAAEDSDARYVDPYDQEFEPEAEPDEGELPPPALDRDFSI